MLTESFGNKVSIVSMVGTTCECLASTLYVKPVKLVCTYNFVDAYILEQLVQKLVYTALVLVQYGILLTTNHLAKFDIEWYA